MLHEETIIHSDNYQIKADIKIPNKKSRKIGIVLSHGAIINRNALSRKTYCLAEHLCKNLNTYIITPDYLGETIHNNNITFNSFSEILDISINYMSELYGIEEVMGFGYSMGCYVLSETINKNSKITSTINYGGPTTHMFKQKNINFMIYLIEYFGKFNYSIDLKNLLKYFFDKETKDYLFNVMLKRKEFGYENYDFKIEPKILKEFLDKLKNYFNVTKKWGKPSLLLFGTKDSIVKNALEFFPNGYKDKNIIVKHIKNASHVTPCMDTLLNLKKLDPIINFFDFIYGNTLEAKVGIKDFKYF